MKETRRSAILSIIVAVLLFPILTTAGAPKEKPLSEVIRTAAGKCPGQMTEVKYDDRRWEIESWRGRF